MGNGKTRILQHRTRHRFVTAQSWTWYVICGWSFAYKLDMIFIHKFDHIEIGDATPSNP